MPVEILIAFKTFFVVGMFAFLFIAERFYRASPVKRGAARLWRNGGLWVGLILLSPLIVLPLTMFAGAHPLFERPYPFAGAIIVDMIILDLWAYGLHRAYHEAPLISRLHRVHHLDETLDTTTAVRFHPGEATLSAALRMAPIIVLAIPFAHVVLFETALLAASLFHHSNVRLPRPVERALSHVIVTPSIHWVHHHADPSDARLNYGAIFSIWDRLFRTQSRTPRTPDMEIGVAGVEDMPLALLLLAPFRKAD